MVQRSILQSFRALLKDRSAHALLEYAVLTAMAITLAAGAGDLISGSRVSLTSMGSWASSLPGWVNTTKLPQR